MFESSYLYNIFPPKSGVCTSYFNNYLINPDWRLETGDWRLETGDWRLAAANFPPFRIFAHLIIPG